MGRMTELRHVLTLVGLACLGWSGEALGQSTAALATPLITPEGAVQLDTGLANVLASGTLRATNGQYAPNAVHAEYSGQGIYVYQPMVQAHNPDSLYNSTGEAHRVPSPAQDAGFSWQAASAATVAGRADFTGSQRMYQPVARVGAAGSDDEAGASARPTDPVAAMGGGGVAPTSCLDLPAGCSALTLPTLTVVSVIRRPSVAQRKPSIKALTGGFGSSTSRHAGTSSGVGGAASNGNKGPTAP